MKKREFSIYVLAIILVYLVNIFMFFINVNNASYPFKKDINCYSFWEYSTHNGILTVFHVLDTNYNIPNNNKKYKYKNIWLLS